MSNIWFTSDTHFHHKNIVTGETSWAVSEAGQQTRNFKTLQEHDEHIIAQFNKYVKPEDELWHLGDWSFGGIEQLWNFRRRLFCRKVHLTYGNHDHHIQNLRILPNCHFNEKGDESIVVDGPPSRGFEASAASLFSSVQDTYFGKIGQKTFFLSHYAHRVWNKSHHGVIHLYGHSHDSLDRHPNQPWGKSMDVSIDSAKRILGEYRPFHIDEILKIMDKRQALILDHHNSKTN